MESINEHGAALVKVDLFEGHQFLTGFPGQAVQNLERSGFSLPHLGQSIIVPPMIFSHFIAIFRSCQSELGVRL